MPSIQTFTEKTPVSIMDGFHKFMLSHFGQLFALAAVWNLGGIGVMLWRRKRRGLVLPKTNDPDVVFSERHASGSSYKSWITRLGGASRCLTVIVTRTQLAITTYFPFTAFAGTYDLEHVVPLKDITRAGTRGRITEIEFLLPDGTRRKVVLRLKDTAGFLRALGRQAGSAQVGATSIP